MTAYVVYGDLLFLMNFLMDFTLLFGVSHFGNFKTGKLSLFLSSLLAAFYGVAAVYPQFSVLNSIFFKTLASFAIVKVAFWSCHGKKFFRAVAYFYLLSFLMAGTVMGMTWFFSDQGWTGQGMSFTAMALGFGLLVALVLSRLGVSYVKANLRRNEGSEDIEIYLNGKSVRVNALLDTGNELSDPVTGYPVAVVEFEAVRSLLPLDFADAFMRLGTRDIAGLLTEFMDKPIGGRLRLIPFSSIGRRNGMLVGIRPDCLKLPQRKYAVVDKAVICLYRGSLNTRESCDCIVNPAILDAI